MTTLAAIIAISSGLGYALPAIVGLESMGVPSPGETALLLAAGLASKGKLNIVLVIVIACASAIVGDNIAYFLGRKLGREVLVAPGPFQAHREKIITVGEQFFSKHGSFAVFLGRWVALARIAVAWLGGITKMPFHVFFFWNALGGITWATTFGLVGYFGGQALQNVIHKVGLYGAIGIAVVVVIGAVVLKLRERRASRASEPGRDPAASSQPDG